MKRPVPRHLIHRVLGPGPVVLVTASVKGHADISTVAWAMPLSGDPPLVVIAVEPVRHLHELISRSDEFTINGILCRLCVARDLERNGVFRI